MTSFIFTFEKMHNFFIKIKLAEKYNKKKLFFWDKDVRFLM